MPPTDMRPPRITDADGAPLISGAELRRWYWLRSEVAAGCRAVGVSTAGSKGELTDRLAAALDGEPPPPPVGRAGASVVQLVGPMRTETVIPAGQRCSQSVREWLIDRIGPSFRFDAPMREFFGRADGSTTLGDAVAHWHATRDGTPRPVDPQFEYNRFTRAWHASHPAGTREQLLTAWRRYRDLPVEARGRA